MHPRRYREFHRTEVAYRVAISGYEVAQRQKRDGERHGWHNAKIDRHDVTAGLVGAVLGLGVCYGLLR